VYQITYADGVADDLGRVPGSHRAGILDRIELQLRIGEYRVFYDVDEVELTVIIRAIRHKPPHK